MALPSTAKATAPPAAASPARSSSGMWTSDVRPSLFLLRLDPAVRALRDRLPRDLLQQLVQLRRVILVGVHQPLQADRRAAVDDRVVTVRRQRHDRRGGVADG